LIARLALLEFRRRTVAKARDRELKKDYFANLLKEWLETDLLRLQ
jgi:hypothetical protein